MLLLLCGFVLFVVAAAASTSVDANLTWNTAVTDPRDVVTSTLTANSTTSGTAEKPTTHPSDETTAPTPVVDVEEPIDESFLDRELDRFVGREDWEPTIKSWNADVHFHVKHRRDGGRGAQWHHDESPFRNGRNFDNVNTFSGELQRYLEFNKLPLRSDATIGGYIVQDLDHFNRTNTKKWKQYFYYNTDNSNGSNEVNFLILGGEGAIYESQVLDNRSMMMIWAKRFGANAFALEHRFYGDSQPTGNLMTHHLKYLTVEQALADAAVFIKSINRRQKVKNPKWIVFGGSYPGNLAAWLRLKYPHLVRGAVASSAPLLAKSDYIEYYQVVQEGLKRYGGPNCSQDVRTFFAQAVKLVRFKDGRASLGICKSHDFSAKDIDYYMETHLSRYGWEVQADGVDHERVLSTCRNTANLAARVLAAASAPGGPKTSRRLFQGCAEYSYRKYIETLQNPTPTWSRAWIWQTCTQFGYFQTAAQSGGLFEGSGINRAYYTDLCRDVFGDLYRNTDIDAIIAKTNQIYGGADNYNGTNVVFVNGSEDPWHPLGIFTQPSRPYLKAIYVEGTSHCRDMYAPTDRDPTSLVGARNTIRAYIHAWLR